ncbi:MAG: transcriptional regulator [Ignavibacteria bacterium]|nr:transcriptional regulator [Ignavibacteria bacterium]
MKTVGQIIRETREKKGLLQRHLAAMLDIDTAILSKFERNERKISKELLLKISEILKIDFQELLVQYQSDRIAYEIAYEENASKILKIAEKKVNYLKSM